MVGVVPMSAICRMRSPFRRTPQYASLRISFASRSVTTLSNRAKMRPGSLKGKFQPIACSRTEFMKRCCRCIRPKSMFRSWRKRTKSSASTPSRS